MTGFARLVMIGLLAALTLGGTALPAAAQDDGIDFDDMTGIQQAMTRIFGSPSDRELSAGVDGPRDLGKPLVAMLLTAVYSFDTEANAAASFELLRSDMNATGFSGQPLELAPITLPTGLEHSAATATDTAFGDPYNFTLAMALDGTFIYTVIGITTGAAPTAGFTAILTGMSAGQVGADPATLDPSGASSGGLWGKMPTLEMIERDFRGIESVEDGQPFPV